MNFAKTHISSTIKSTLNRNSNLKATINCSILDTHLQKCRNLKEFNQIHSQMVVSGFINDTFAASRLLKFSTDFQFVHLEYSRRILDFVENPNGFIWNTMMRSCLQRNSAELAIQLYKVMLEKNVEPDNYTYPILVQASTVRFSAQEGKEIHTHVLKLGFDSDVYVLNTLINMYAVCGNLSDARRLFDGGLVLDSVSWNSILAGYVQIGDVEEATLIFDQMPKRNAIASNSMIALFGKTGRVNDARELFDDMAERDMVSWSAMVSCYEQNEMFEEALVMFAHMNVEGIMVDEVVMVSVLSACASLLAIKEGELIHGLSLRIGIESYINLHNALIHMYSRWGDIKAARRLFDASQLLDQISWNSMVSGYLKCGSVEDARALFDSMPKKDVVSWSVMISGYAQHDHFSEALALFHEMQLKEIRPDETTLVSVISACAHLAALDQGKWVHAYIKKNDLKINSILGTTLIDMYMKFGCVENALEVFYGMEEKGVSSWNALIVGLAMNGLVERSLEMFSEMKRCGVAPNEITFVGILGACRHVGLVNEGRRYFESMIQIYKIEPNVKHYGCMVDLLGRAGLLKEAKELIEGMPMTPDVATWGALLGACKKHGDTDMGVRVGKKLIELHPDHDGFHVLLSNIYASKGWWDDVIEIRGMMKHQGVVKTPGCSLIEVNGVVHEFLAGYTEHPQMKEIDRMLDEMANRLKMEGYAPNTNEVALDIDDEEKETSLNRHSEKIAIAFGIISTSASTPIRIMKNLRICGDCHTMTKAISRVFGREIVVRDRHRFHHFKQGSCSCMDYCSLIHGLCNSDQWKEATRLFNEMIARNISPNKFTINKLVDALCKEGMIKEAHELLGLMIQKGEKPDVVTYNTLMDGYCLQGQIKEAAKNFDSMMSGGHKPNVISYNILINGYCKAMRLDEAMQLCGDMRFKGLIPNTITYSTLIGGLCKVGRLVDALELFYEMQTHGQIPNIITYGILLEGLFTNNYFSEAMKLFHVMESNGLKANIVIYNIIIDSMCKDGNLKAAKELFCNLSAKDVQPDILTYNTMINGFLKGGLLKEAEDLFIEMEEKGFTPNEVTFNTMVQGFFKNKAILKAMQLLDEMVERGFSSNAETTSMVVTLLVKDGSDHEHMEMLRKFLTKG